MNKRIYLASPHMSDEGYEQSFIKEAFDSNWIAPAGANIDNFEKELSDYVGIPYATALTSCTAALHAAVRLTGATTGDVVFCQTYTYVATANAILYEGATPVFIDSEPDTWNMCPKALEEAFKKYKNVKAVMVVHIYGMAAKMDELLEICNRYNVPLIEDAAESLGSLYKGKHTGTLGTYGCYSFNGNKIITTSLGGMFVSRNREEVERVRNWSAQAKVPAPYFQHEEVGYTTRMSNVLAGIGRGQLKVLEKRVEKKRYIYNYYKKGLSDIKEISFMPIHDDINRSNCWLTALQIEGKVKPIDIKNALEENNIESRLAWKPMHLQPLFKDCDFVGTNVAETLYNKGICLPSDTKLTDDDLDRIIGIIRGLF